MQVFCIIIREKLKFLCPRKKEWFATVLIGHHCSVFEFSRLKPAWADFGKSVLHLFLILTFSGFWLYILEYKNIFLCFFHFLNQIVDREHILYHTLLLLKLSGKTLECKICKKFCDYISFCTTQRRNKYFSRDWLQLKTWKVNIVCVLNTILDYFQINIARRFWKQIDA